MRFPGGAALSCVALQQAWDGRPRVALFPFLAQRAIDRGLVPGDWWQLALWLALLLVNGLATAICGALRHRGASEAGARGGLGLRARLFRHLLGLDISFHDRADRGDVLTRVTTDVNTVSVFIDLIVTWVAHTLSIVLVVVLMLQMDLGLGLIGAAFIPFVLVLMAVVMRPYEARTTALREATSKLNGILHENITGARVIKGFGAEVHQVNRHHLASGEIVSRAMALARPDTAYKVLFAILPAAAMVAVLWWGGLRAVSGDLTVGVLLAFSAWMVQLTYRTEGQVERFLWLMQARASARRVNALLRLQPAVTEIKTPSPLI